MKKMLFSITLIVLGGLLICSSLIAGSIWSASINQIGNITSLDILDSGVAVSFTIFGVIIAIIGTIMAISDIIKDEKSLTK